MRAQGLVRKHAWAAPADEIILDMAAIRESVKQELQASWEPELKAMRLAEERKQARAIAKNADHDRRDDRIAGLCEAADYFITKERPDIAQSLLAHFHVSRDDATAALQPDKRTKSLTLASLVKHKAWGKSQLTQK
jgi:hypothetical protein